MSKKDTSLMGARVNSVYLKKYEILLELGRAKS